MNKKIKLILSCLLFSLFISGCTDNEINKSNYGDISITENENDDSLNNTSFNGDLQIYYLDVGQADSSLIIFPSGKTMLIDAGNNQDGEKIVEFIKSKNINTIDILVGTHPHADHIGGMDDVIDEFDIGDIYMPKIPNEFVPTTKTYKEVLESANNKGEKIISPHQKDLLLNENDEKIQILSDVTKITGKDMNTYSIVLKISYGNNTFMFTGDADEDVEKIILNSFSQEELQSDVLKSGHHGSYTASSVDWLTALMPKYSIISCGIGNQYGHPHDITLNRYKENNIETYRTDLQGNISLKSDGNLITILSEK